MTAMSKNPEAKTSAVTILCQLGPAFPSRRLRCLSSMLLQCLEQPLFDDLRTKQQLCYAVSASMPIMGCVTSMSFHVLSGTHCPSHLKAKTDEFLQASVHLHIPCDARFLHAIADRACLRHVAASVSVES